ncbi:hypothetical protein HMPREF1544_06303 [Mucor circinelloides 1006PhL]|uniref:NAD(+) diphosphatase n=1 Tax=Mucor circinelloides f. circinelloides (strain 1006PhL) TaxID=1220926 RepID=S2JEK6_MUCC1|nr:hypothetical protein HMPREF1544_06303 [Mucor circinelloides 1006PhL]
MSTTIFEAAAEGNLDYLKKNTKLVNDKNERGWTPLHFAARFGQLEVAKFLKDNKADLSIVNGEGKTAAQVASFWGNDEIAKLLTVAAAPVPTSSAHGLASGSPFPDNYTAVFAGNPLNRFGWNRGKPEFLARLARSPKAKYIILNRLKALYDSEGNLHYAKYDQVSSVVDRVYTENDVVPNNSDIILIFMGIDESQGQGEDGEFIWALDLTPQGANEEEYSGLVKGFEAQGLEFSPTLPRAFVMEKSVSAIIAQAAAMVDWNARTKFCSACGERTISQEAGYKRNCPTVDGQEKGEQCISHTGIQNFAYPRTDAVVIVCIIHPNGDKILLGRQKRWPNKMFSCISGFVEAAETLEEAVRREAFEETGVIVDRVAYHSSQPWPFPNSLMLGFIAEAVSTDIHFRDDELESAQWFTRSEVIAAVKGDLGSTFSMAPKGSLASTLVHAWINDKKWQQPTPNTTAKM